MKHKFQFLNKEYDGAKDIIQSKSDLFLDQMSRVLEIKIGNAKNQMFSQLIGDTNNIDSYEKCKLIEATKYLNKNEYEEVIISLNLELSFYRHLWFDRDEFNILFEKLISQTEIAGVYSFLLIEAIDIIYNTNIRLQVLNDEHSMLNHKHGFNQIDKKWRTTLNLNEEDLEKMKGKSIINYIIRESIMKDMAQFDVPKEIGTGMLKSSFSVNNSSYLKSVYDLILNSITFYDGTTIPVCCEIVFPLIIFSKSADGSKKLLNRKQYYDLKEPIYKSHREYCRQKLRVLLGES